MEINPQEVRQEQHNTLEAQELTYQPQGLIKTASRSRLPVSSEVTIRKADKNDAEAISRLGRYIFTLSFGYSVEQHELQAYLDTSYTKEAISRDISDPNMDIIVATTTKRMDTNINRFESVNNNSDNPRYMIGDDDHEKAQMPLSNEVSGKPRHSSAAAAAQIEKKDNTEASVYEDVNKHKEKETTTTTIIGFAQLTRNTHEPSLSHLPVSAQVELQRIYLHPEYHGSGVAGQLAARIESLARDQKFKHLWLGVWEENRKAQRAYEKWGFRVVGTHDFVIGSVVQTDLILLKDLM